MGVLLMPVQSRGREWNETRNAGRTWGALTVSTLSLIQNINEEAVERPAGGDWSGCSHRKMIWGWGGLCVLGWVAGERQRCIVFHFLPWKEFLSWKHDSPPHKGWLLFMTAPWESWALMPTVQMSKGPGTEKGFKPSSQGNRVCGWNLGSHPCWPDHREWL